MAAIFLLGVYIYIAPPFLSLSFFPLNNNTITSHTSTNNTTTNEQKCCLGRRLLP